MGPWTKIFAARRCAHCYLPMHYSFMCCWWKCELCDSTVPDEWLAHRPRWRRWYDYLTGLDPRV